MTDDDVLRRALNEIDGLRYRWGWVCGIMAALSQVAWIALAVGAEKASEKGLILLATFALACTVFGGVFMLALLMYRMTYKLLQAIELSGRRG